MSDARERNAKLKRLKDEKALVDGLLGLTSELSWSHPTRTGFQFAQEQIGFSAQEQDDGWRWEVTFSSDQFQDLGSETAFETLMLAKQNAKERLEHHRGELQAQIGELNLPSVEMS